MFGQAYPIETLSYDQTGSLGAALPVVALQREHFWRCLPEQYLQTVLETGPSFTRPRRYSIRGEFGGLYFSASKELPLSEVASSTGQDSEVMSCAEFEITVDRLVDLTRPKIRAALRVSLEDLIRPRASRDAYELPPSIARQVYRERLNGILAPSVYDPKGQRRGWFNLVLYPVNLGPAFIREVHVHRAPLPSP